MLSLLSVRAAVIDGTEASLRAALAAGGDINFGQDASITLTQSLSVASTASLNANGHTVTISGANKVRLFSVQGASLTLLGLNLVGGRSQNGGAIFVAADGALVASNCTFTGNAAQGSNGVAGAAGPDNASGSGEDGRDGIAGNTGAGGAIFNRGIVSLLRCTLATNSATGGNGGAGGNGGNGRWNGGNGGAGAVAGMGLGGAIYNLGNLSVMDSTISDNSATGGNGGAGGTGGTGSTPGLTGQAGAGAAGSGGGICNGSNLSLSGSTLARNTVQGGNSPANGTEPNGNGHAGLNGGDGAGGGLCTLWQSGVTNCTFVANKATGGTGGTGGSGRWNAGDGGDGGNGVGGGIQNGATLVLMNCTLTHCGAFGGTNGIAGTGSAHGQAGAAGHPWGGNIASTSGACLLLNSLIAWESFGACGYGNFTDGGYNLTTDNSVPLGSTSLPNTAQPKIGAFGLNGGPTATVALLPGSPAIDKIPPSASPPTDQRGAPRPINDLSDIGAVEYDGASAPIIFQEPADQTVTTNSSVTFSVSAGGATPLSYQWRFQNTPITGATTASYTVASVTATNTGPYDVVITNRLGSVTSRQAFFHLAPTITLQPTNQTASAGSTVTFATAATGDPPLAFQWSLNSTNILTGATNPVLTLNNVQMAQIGAYSVAVTNAAGAALSGSATLNLRPTILVQPTDQAVAPGGSAGFSVTAVGTPPLRYQWRKNGAAIAGATLSGYTNADVQVSDTGTYDLTITNGFGSITSRSAALQVVLGINGHVSEGDLGLGGVSLAFGPTVAVTDSSGDFSANVPNGLYVITPTRTDYAFQPARLSVTIPPSTNNLNFQAFPLMSIRAGGNSLVQLSAGGITGVVYKIEASTNLANWQGIFTNPAPIQFSDGLSNAGRFYRLTR